MRFMSQTAKPARWDCDEPMAAITGCCALGVAVPMALCSESSGPMAEHGSRRMAVPLGVVGIALCGGCIVVATRTLPPPLESSG